MLLGASNCNFALISFSTLFLTVLDVTHGENKVGSSVTLNSTSGYFSASDESLKPNTTWTVDIKPPNATHIFVVMEQISLDENDSLSIIGVDRTLNETKGTHAPFSFLYDGESITLVLNTSGSHVDYRRIAGYYTMSGCIYQLNETYGRFSTPQLYTKTDTANCSFSFSKLPAVDSKVGVTFLEFHLDNSELYVISDGVPNYTYNGSSIPPEIISENLELNFTLHENDTAMFLYEPVTKESDYVVLNSSNQSHDFSYMPSQERGDYSFEQECHWVIKGDEKTTISFKFSNFSLQGAYIVISDGKNFISHPLVIASSIDEKDIEYRYVSSSGNFLWISIEEPQKNTVIMGKATMHQNGGYKTGSGKLSVPSNSMEVVYLLDEDEGENVVLSEHSGKLISNSTIYVYDDFYTNSAPIAVYNTSLPSYPIVSSTSKMMVIAKSFGQNVTYGASYEAVKQGCYKMSTTGSGEYFLIGNCNTTCKWIVPPTEEAVNKDISLHLHSLKIEEHDAITLNLLDANQTVIANIKSNKDLPEFYLPSSSGFLLSIVRGNCSSSPALHGAFEKKKGCSLVQELSPGTNVSVKSPNFPDRYPFWAHCWTNVTATKTTKDSHFLLTFSKIDLAATHCLRIRSNVRNSSEVIKTYEGTESTLPDDLIVNDTVSVEFLAQSCNSTKKEPPIPTTSSGFHLDILSADCGGKLALKEGNFSTPDFPKNTSASICIWVLEVPEKEIINFTLSRNITKDNELEIYDGPSIRYETIKNHSTSMILSRRNSLIFIYHRNTSAKTLPGIQVTFHSQKCSKRCQNGLCIHDDWTCNGVNDCGDNTDEIGCEEFPIPSTTAPPPAEQKSCGALCVALAVMIPIAFIVGILATIYSPPLIRRFRSGQYHQFRDVSADA